MKRIHTHLTVPFRQKITLILFGIFLTLILLEIGLRLGGFILLSLQEYRNIASVRQRGEYRIMCVGESTTQGQYPPFLEGILNQRNIGIRFSVTDKGGIGTNTQIILDKLESNLDKYHPDMVSTMMGINDFGTHLPYEVVSRSKAILFLRSFRTYKLIRLLWLHLVTTAKEKGIFPSKVKPQFTLQPMYAKQTNNVSIEEARFKKALELNPKDDQAYLGLGMSYLSQANFSQAEDYFKKALELNPKDDQAYLGLGMVYLKNQGNLFHAEVLFKKALELNPKNVKAYTHLGNIYLNQGNLSHAEAVFKKAIELDPKNYIAYMELGKFYLNQGNLSHAEAVFKKAIELNPHNDRFQGGLSRIYYEIGNHNLAEEYSKKADELRMRYYLPFTVNNYRRLKEILDKRGIHLVCVQYPMRSIEPLKSIFEERQGIIFVDNEEIFKKAVKEDGYKTYFMDMFGGDFGHCTPKGNRLLAENIANAILKGIFRK